MGYVWCEICVGYVWCEIRQQSSEEPCDETSFGKKATKDRKVLTFLMLSQLGGGNISLFAHPRLDDTLTAFSSAS